LSFCGTDIVGFFSFDPRPQPAYGVIGHNCILPEYRNRGLGKQQIVEVLQKLRQIGLTRTLVSASSHSFFVPAQRMYIACGFVEMKRIPWERDPNQYIIHYEMNIEQLCHPPFADKYDDH
jgi:ribosomal protein S18 acetylase RimI-like enzyme